jgi:hypothetical protein
VKYTFELEVFTIILLAALAVAFMIWVFWSLSQQIRAEVRSRGSKPQTLSEGERCSEAEIKRGTLFVSAEARPYSETRDRVSRSR